MTRSKDCYGDRFSCNSCLETNLAENPSLSGQICIHCCGRFWRSPDPLVILERGGQIWGREDGERGAWGMFGSVALGDGYPCPIRRGTLPGDIPRKLSLVE